MNRAYIEESNYDERKGWTAKNKRQTICLNPVEPIQDINKIEADHGRFTAWRKTIAEVS